MCSTFLLLKMHEMHFSVGMSCSASPSICISFYSMCDGNLRGVSSAQSFTYVILSLNDNPDCSREKRTVLFSLIPSQMIFLTDVSI